MALLIAVGTVIVVAGGGVATVAAVTAALRRQKARSRAALDRSFGLLDPLLLKDIKETVESECYEESYRDFSTASTTSAISDDSASSITIGSSSPSGSPYTPRRRRRFTKLLTVEDCPRHPPYSFEREAASDDYHLSSHGGERISMLQKFRID